MYFRFFKVIGGETLEKTREILEQRIAAKKVIGQFLDEVGAIGFYPSRSSGKVSSLQFQSIPDRALYKESGSGFRPKKTSTESKALLERMEALPIYPDFNLALKHAGLPCDCPAIIDGNRGYFASFAGGNCKDGPLFVKVPWQAVPESELEQYRKDRAAGTHYCLSLDFLQWVPPGDWQELKEWEFLKELEEHKAAKS